MSSAEGVTIHISLVGSQLVVAQADQVGHAVGNIGTQAQQGAMHTSRAMDRVGAALGFAAKVGAAAFATVGTAVAGVAVAALKTGVAYNILQQQSRAAMTTLLGSAVAANAQMDKLDVFARTSPFAKQVFISAQQQLIGFGVAAKDVIPILRAVQDTVAGVGGGNQQISEIVLVMSQIRAAGKITGVDLMQFAQRGVDAASLIGSAMGKTGPQIRAAITAGTLNADVALAALTTGMEKRFGGAAANVKGTMSGTVDRIKAAFRDLGGEIAKPFVDPKGGGSAVKWGNQVADIMRSLQAQVGPVMKEIADRFGSGSDRIGAMLDRVKAGIDNLSRAKIDRVVDGFKRVWDTVKTVSTVVGRFGTSLFKAVSDPRVVHALGSLLGALTPLLPTVVKIVDLFAGALTGALQTVAHTLERVAGWINRNRDWFIPLASAVIQVGIAFAGLKTVFDILRPALMGHPILAIASAIMVIVANWDKINQLGYDTFASHTSGQAVAAGQSGAGQPTQDRGIFGVGLPHGSAGMIVPGYAPGVDTVHTLLSRGEGVLVPEVVRALSPTTINTWNQWGVAQRGAPQRMAFGGIAGTTPTYSPDLIGRAMQKASWKSVFTVGQAVSAAGQVAGVLGAAAQVINGVKAAATSGNDPVQKWRPIAVQALQMTGHYTAANLAAMMQRLGWESSGNPLAINNWDRNAKNGTPSKGLWQVIDPTFRTYAQPGFNKNIYDPLSNALASINYAKATYGSLEKAYGLRHADGSVAGYDKGGWLPARGVAVSNMPSPEAILTHSQWSDIHTLAKRSQAGGASHVGGNTYHVTFNIKGAQDPEAIMREVEAHWAELAERHDRRARVRSL